MDPRFSILASGQGLIELFRVGHAFVRPEVQISDFSECQGGSDLEANLQGAWPDAFPGK